MVRSAKFHEKGVGRALIELAEQYNPKDGVRELVTNSIDAMIPGSVGKIVVTLNPDERRIIISDNGTGIDYVRLNSLPLSIGYSLKKGTDKRGEKGLGLLAFGSLGEVMHIITKPYDAAQADYGYLRYMINRQKEEIELNDANQTLSPREVESDFYGNFPHGTRTIIDRVDPHIMDKVLTLPNLKNWLRLLYNPVLKKGTVDIELGRLDRKGNFKSESLEDLKYSKDSSIRLVDTALPVTIKNEENGTLEALLFIDPEAVFDKVAAYSKDVLVYESLAELPEFSKSPVWTSGKVSGYFNDFFNKLILGRAGIDRKRNAFKAWLEKIREVEEQIRPIVEEKRKHGVHVKENADIKASYDALADALKELRSTNFGGDFVRSKDGVLINVVGVPPAAGTSKKKPKDDEKPTPPKPGAHPGPGSFVQAPEGEGTQERVVPKNKGDIFGHPQPKPFPENEGYLRAKLEDVVGTPTPFLNSLHDDYKTRADDSKAFRRYVIDVVSPLVADYEIRKEALEGKLIGEKTEIVARALQKTEALRFLALKNLGIL